MTERHRDGSAVVDSFYGTFRTANGNYAGIRIIHVMGDNPIELWVDDVEDEIGHMDPGAHFITGWDA